MSRADCLVCGSVPCQQHQPAAVTVAENEHVSWLLVLYALVAQPHIVGTIIGMHECAGAVVT